MTDDPINHHSNAQMGIPSSRWQRILNTAWPQRDEHGRHARDVPFGTESTLVEARVRWLEDGWDVVAGRVTRRANGCVYVQIEDRRMVTPGVWLRESDVRSR